MHATVTNPNTKATHTIIITSPTVRVFPMDLDQDILMDIRAITIAEDFVMEGGSNDVATTEGVVVIMAGIDTALPHGVIAIGDLH